MKLKFIGITFLLLFARGCDFYSTSLWFFENPSHETNPLVQLFNAGWTGLILVNVIVIGLVLYAYYLYAFTSGFVIRKPVPGNLLDFVSMLYFNEKGKFYKLFYRWPVNRKVWIGHTGFILVRVIIFASLLATVHNLCQYYQVPVYDAYRDIVGRPLWVIYGLILCSFIFFSIRLWKKEYNKALRLVDKHAAKDISTEA